MEFNFDVIYLKGIDNVLADQLSRLFPPVDKLGEDIVLEKDNKMTYKRKNITYKKVNGTVRAIRRNTKNKFDISKHVEYNSGDYFTPPKEERKAILLRAHVFGHFGSESIRKDCILWKGGIDEKRDSKLSSASPVNANAKIVDLGPCSR
ncbi:hypothetical protein [Parasitella parasitica]|uniref:Integrase zinc-binding domain-containing protein n=1 Tax=Parasitella parasitica TaxID=35722 RepID=A0A0B7NME3_9FUNG|nr:hypothetical protein [Parasitella parasitica]